MKKSIEKLLDRIRENDWSVTVRGNYINIGKYSPAGQDFCFDIDVTDFEEENDITAASQQQTYLLRLYTPNMTVTMFHTKRIYGLMMRVTE